MSAVYIILLAAFLLLSPGACTADLPVGHAAGKTGHLGGQRPGSPKLWQLQAAAARSSLRSAAAAAAAVSTDATATAAEAEMVDKPAGPQRTLLQEHVCKKGQFWIHCNSRPLCGSIGRGAPTTACGTEAQCQHMCDMANKNRGICHQQWNLPSQTYYYSIIYGGAVFCDPSRGGSRARSL